MSVPISAMRIWAEVSLKPGTSFRSFKGVTKGLERGLDQRASKARDRLFQLRQSGLYMLADEEAMMSSERVRATRLQALRGLEADVGTELGKLSGSVSPAIRSPSRCAVHLPPRCP